MSPELSWLVASVVLLFVYVLGEATLGNLQYNTKDLLGSRDSLDPPSTTLSRASRATRNMVEAMIMFVPLILTAVIAGRTNDMTALGAAIFFWARLAYAPMYWFGIPVARTLAWGISVIGLVLIFLQIIPFSGA